MTVFLKKFIAVLTAAFLAFGAVPAMPARADDISYSDDESAGEASQTDGEVEGTVTFDEISEMSGGTLSESAPEVDAECAVLMDAETGAVLYSKNPDRQMYPASITKIMTCLLALENSDLDDTVVFSFDAVYKNEADSSHIARDLDEEMTMEQTLYAVMLESANECAYAVAEHVGGGDYQSFIDMMNERAKELGCKNTHFTNANGLPDEEHVTTAYDMALIAREAIKDPEYREIIGTASYVIPPTNKHEESTYLNNHNKMINNYKGSEHLYEYCIGGKTGYTESAGNTFVSYAEKDGKLLISVVLRSSSMYDDCEALFEWGFAGFDVVNVCENETRYGDDAEAAGNALFDSGSAYVTLDPEAEITLPAGASFSDTTAELTYEGASDEALGTLDYYYGGMYAGSAGVLITGMREIAEETPVTLEEENAQAGANVSNGRESERRTSAGTRRALVILIVLAAVFVFLMYLTRKGRRRRARLRKKRRARMKKAKASSGKTEGRSNRK